MRDFNHTLSVLVKAYFEGTLQHSNCHACAVGNIVAESNNIKFTGKVRNKIGDKVIWDESCNSLGPNPAWQEVFVTTSFCGEQYINLTNYIGTSARQIDATGYTWMELARVEHAFESAKPGKSDDDFMFNGLMAVVDVLADIHGINLEQKEEAKALFVRH